VRGEGRAAWRIRYRPRPNANQRWFTLSEDAAHADFEEVSRKAAELLTALRLHGTDPQAERRKGAAGERTLTDCFRLWLDHTGKRRQRPLSPKSRTAYEGLFERHIGRHLGKRALRDLDRPSIQDAWRR
jgi:hypothetical protein